MDKMIIIIFLFSVFHSPLAFVRSFGPPFAGAIKGNYIVIRSENKFSPLRRLNERQFYKKFLISLNFFLGEAFSL